MQLDLHDMLAGDADRSFRQAHFRTLERDAGFRHAFGDVGGTDRTEQLAFRPGLRGDGKLEAFELRGAALSLRKLRMPLPDVKEILDTVRAVCDVVPVTVETYDRALAIVARYGFSLYDSLLIAAALIAGSQRLYCEGLQHDQLIDRQLRVVNPFVVR